MAKSLLLQGAAAEYGEPLIEPSRWAAPKIPLTGRNPEIRESQTCPETAPLGLLAFALAGTPVDTAVVPQPERHITAAKPRHIVIAARLAKPSRDDLPLSMA
jgi:hypothetical protein